MNFSAYIGMIVSINQTEKGTLHFDAERSNRAFPTIYDIDGFYNEKFIVVDSARIVPVLYSERVGFGRFARAVSQALYMNEEVAIIVAARNQSTLPINPLTGHPDYMASADSKYILEHGISKSLPPMVHTNLIMNSAANQLLSHNLTQ